MTFTVQAEAPPLREDASGALRVGASRVLLELVIRAFQDGATPETIVQHGFHIDSVSKAWLEKRATPIFQKLHSLAIKSLMKAMPAINPDFTKLARQHALADSSVLFPLRRSFEIAIEDLTPGLTAQVSVANHYSPRMRLAHYFPGL